MTINAQIKTRPSIVNVQLKTPTAVGAVLMSDLLDVDLTNLQNGYILSYNSSTQKWEATIIDGGTY